LDKFQAFRPGTEAAFLFIMKNLFILIAVLLSPTTSFAFGFGADIPPNAQAGDNKILSYDGMNGLTEFVIATAPMTLTVGCMSAGPALCGGTVVAIAAVIIADNLDNIDRNLGKSIENADRYRANIKRAKENRFQPDTENSNVESK
jgi:hypothetical protein